jgi:hypothetical protein
MVGKWPKVIFRTACYVVECCLKLCGGAPPRFTAAGRWPQPLQPQGSLLMIHIMYKIAECSSGVMHVSARRLLLMQFQFLETIQMLWPVVRPDGFVARVACGGHGPGRVANLCY